MKNIQAEGAWVMLSISPALLEMLRLQPGDPFGMCVESRRLVVEPSSGPRYTLQELLNSADYAQPQPPEEREWVDASAAGREEI